MPNWYIYILRCSDDSLYTGITNDLERRFEEHQSGSPKCAKALRGKRPLAMVWSMEEEEKGRALSLEYKIKKLDKEKKELLVSSQISLEDIL